MTKTPPKPRLRVIDGGKAVEPRSKKVMTEIGLLDEADLKAWELVRQVAPPPDDFLLKEIDQEQALIKALLTERLQKLLELYPDANPNDMGSMTPEMLEILYAPPLFVTSDGMILLDDDGIFSI
jgi:hypothetical protein